MSKPGPRCTICAHPQRTEIDARRESVADVARRFGISKSALHRHRQHVAGTSNARPTLSQAAPARVGRRNATGVRSGAQRTPSAGRLGVIDGPPERIDLRLELERLVQRANANADRVDADPQTTARDRSLATGALQAALRALGKLEEGEPPATSLKHALSLPQRDALEDLDVCCDAIKEAQTRGADPERLRPLLIAAVDALGRFLLAPSYANPRPVAVRFRQGILEAFWNFARTVEGGAAERAAQGGA